MAAQDFLALLRAQHNEAFVRVARAYWQARFGWALAVHGERDWDAYEQAVAL